MVSYFEQAATDTRPFLQGPIAFTCIVMRNGMYQPPNLLLSTWSREEFFAVQKPVMLPEADRKVRARPRGVSLI